jgi:hypothetical protein
LGIRRGVRVCGPDEEGFSAGGVEARGGVALTRTMSCASDEATSAALESFAVTDVISADPVNSRVFFSPLVREWRECEAAGGNLEFFF